ncbi:DUF3991 domain-containing protein (plasmid) [Lichenicola cladoniae]|uniref:DUF3991 domain-containing protein n=1 Tax=Lichenicola cladoniae TaxID=1484109 RepID=A0A6M8I123_9PROT|nr:DUF3991 and TOPRIM domain-containing protein [Lichenicola cladoniae]NPD70351.1 DUF3991 domain-containing protein [Acetobacteraceae bacterium]QKE94006.1 DUF3991 domain-containing protein [Lichenicola cladoniae]
MTTDQDELAELRQRVDCRTVLERGGWAMDAAESSRRAVKYRQGSGRIVIVTHEGKGWFDPLNDRRGDVIALAQHVWGGTLGHARKNLRPLAGIAPKLLPLRQGAAVVAIDGERLWNEARHLQPGSQAWDYLTEQRGLPAATVDRAAKVGALREGVHGTMWAQHQAASGRITGWEMRGPYYKGFAKGGTKSLFWLGHPPVADRLVVTESAIDAMSLGSIERWREGTLYASTGGGFGSETEAALRGFLPRHAQLVAATDQGTGGEVLAARLHDLATSCGSDFVRLVPEAKDWNAQLCPDPRGFIPSSNDGPRP